MNTKAFWVSYVVTDRGRLLFMLVILLLFLIPIAYFLHLTAHMNRDNQIIGLASATIVLFIIFIASLITLAKSEKQTERLQRDLSWYQTNHLSKQGATTLWPGAKGQMIDYHLYSLDAGRNWYAIERKGEEIIIKGETEKIYPGLLKHLDNWDKLWKHVEANGPLNPSKSEDVKFLESIGFTVTNAEAK